MGRVNKDEDNAYYRKWVAARKVSEPRYRLEEQATFKAQRRKELHDFVNADKRLGCTKCSENDPIVIDYHHVGKKRNTIAGIISSSCTLDRLKDELTQCVRLCSNCHRKLHASEKSGPYATTRVGE